MFDPSDQPRLFGVPPGVEFPAALVAGLRSRLAGQPPEALARVDLIVNTQRMKRRLREIFDSGPSSLLPRIRLLTDLDTLAPGVLIPPPTPGLRRRLELIQLISRLLDSAPEIAPRASLYALSDSLASLIDEMQGEGVSAEQIAALDVSDASGHWDRAKQFLTIAQTYLARMSSLPDVEARQRQLVEAIAARWQDAPPTHPVIVAGSTGSRGTTSLLMQAVAGLPNGALVLPGFDFDMPTDQWGMLDSSQPPEDHPQFRFFALMKALSVPRSAVGDWAGITPPSPPRNALVSLSLRPAPVTDSWLIEGPKLADIEAATDALTMVRAPTPRIEALAIALRLRRAVEAGQTAALITPDRMLTRQVTAALDRWNILPDDSAGTPLQLSPPGRFLRHVAQLFVRKLDAEALLTLLKHPLTHSGSGRNTHQLNTQRLEMRIRREGLPYPDAAGLRRVGEAILERLADPGDFSDWLDWLVETFGPDRRAAPSGLEMWVERHLALAEQIAMGKEAEADSELWKQKAGQGARQVMTALQDEAAHGGQMSASDYADLVASLLSGAEVRDRDAPHPDIMIWGTLEARVQGAELVILGGLNDGVWPEAPAPDPWLNRQMRLQAGLLLPERRIGLSAHDYQQAIAAPEVVLTRAIRSDEAETVPSRWVNRLENLLNGLPDGSGKEALERMTARGDDLIAQVQAMETYARRDPAPRPSPRPPVSARPRTLSVTQIKTLIRDPYAIYARHALGLRPVNALVQTADAPGRGNVVHDVLEAFIRAVAADPSRLTKADLLRIADEVLLEQAPWPAARLIWRARIERVADWFIGRERERQRKATPMLLEEDARGILKLEELGFTLIGKADRIDRDEDGTALIYDYKTGTPPSKNEQKFFDKQLLLEAAMIEKGSFEKLGPTPVSAAVFIGLGTKPVEVDAPLAEEPPVVVLKGLRSLIESYLAPEQGFTARRAIKTEDATGDYDQLARFGEWDGTTPATPEDLA